MSVMSAVLALAVIGAVCALVLVLASKFMAVPVDEKFPAIRECLPGANCGACGYAGCDGYAQALADGSETRPNLCIPGAAGAAAAVAKVLGVDAGEVEEKRAFVRCSGDCETAKRKYEYQGVTNCSAAKILFSGEWACPNSCLGYGDCEAACPSDAIHVVNGVAKVDYRKCTGCGICVRGCPNQIIDLRPVPKSVIVRCSNTQKGAQAMKVCDRACIGCMKCQKTCPSDAIHVTNFLASIDYSKCTSCSKCAEVCPKHVIEKLF
ncbi:MAG: RnfABCDGE type electron transport complex subunit B [Oscillospiraceae bacterium]|nr:RnfABCDGE type electron transport complex subunit B [Oscillospiraceae bacterium]MBR6209473.1 RnfABCDGE type electron transport complex subunit B [Oscillospiraceae bacterium]